MKKAIFAVSALAAFAVHAVAPAIPYISEQSLVNNGDGTVTITYTLNDGPAIVTLDVLAAGVSIGATNLWALSGDVNMVVDKTNCSITWNPSVAWKGYSTARLSAALTAWPLDDPPDYLVFDLTTNPVVRKRYYASEDAIPGGIIANEAYRRYLLPMRRMHSKDVAWQMGSPLESGAGFYNAAEAEHTVTLDHDYYIGVFEVTRGQYATVRGSWTAVSGYTQAESIAAMRPLLRITYNNARGSAAANLYPGPVAAASYVGYLQNRTGDSTLDLPSEAEWEFAARGGHYGEVWGDGTSIGNNDWDAHLQALGRVNKNNSGASIVDGTRGSYAICGSYKKNDYGLYDINGNVWEWCLDWYQQDITWNTTGAVNANGANLLDGETAGSTRVSRGGAFGSNTQYCRNCFRTGGNQVPGNFETSHGMRLVCRDTLP